MPQDRLALFENNFVSIIFKVSTQLESGGPTIPENDSNQVNPKAEDGNFHADAQTAGGN